MAHWAAALLGVKKEEPSLKKQPITVYAKPKSASIKPLPQSIAAAEVETTSFVDSVIDDLDKLTPSSAKKHKPEPITKKITLKDWPNDPHSLVDYEDLVAPVKKIIDQGYRLIRNNTKSFEYEGYEIGEVERQTCPSPKYRFTENILEFENKRTNRNLIDVALNVIYLLGIENGRRAERRREQPINTIIATLADYRQDNKDLRLKIDKLTAELAVLKEHPNTPDAETKTLIAAHISANRDSRLKQLRDDLSKDPRRSSFSPSKTSRASFNHLVGMAKQISCSRQEWNMVIENHGWKPDEFWSTAKKKKIKLTFT